MVKFFPNRNVLVYKNKYDTGCIGVINRTVNILFYYKIHIHITCLRVAAKTIRDFLKKKRLPVSSMGGGDNASMPPPVTWFH